LRAGLLSHLLNLGGIENGLAVLRDSYVRLSHPSPHVEDFPPGRKAMKNFRVYPKRGEPFTILIDKFSRDGNQFILYGHDRRPSNDGFLSFEHIAAIVPEEPMKRPSNDYMRDAFDFRVYLRHGEQFDINADSCDATDPVTIKFFVVNRDGENVEISGIYIASSEVVAVIPPDGLIYRD
jgi:hypothetical protein